MHGGGADGLGHRDEVTGRGDVDAGGEEQVGGDGGQPGNDTHGIGPRRLVLPARSAVFSNRVGVLGFQLAWVEQMVGYVNAAVAEVVAGLGDRDGLPSGQEGDRLVEARGVGHPRQPARAGMGLPPMGAEGAKATGMCLVPLMKLDCRR